MVSLKKWKHGLSQEIEEEVFLEVIKSKWGTGGDEIETKLQPRDRFFHYMWEPSSWVLLCGREYYYVKREDEIIYKKLTLLS